MPPFGDLLSDDEIRALAAYVVDASASSSCQVPPLISGTREPSARTPVTSCSGAPIITSTWMAERLTPRAPRCDGSGAREPAKPLPSAMWLTAFSSSSVRP